MVLAWDLRWQKEPMQLSGSSDLKGQFIGDSMAESEIWEVKFDPFSLSGTNATSSNISPIMICSEDGILGVVETGLVLLLSCNLSCACLKKKSMI